MSLTIKEVILNLQFNQSINIKGWVKAFRSNRFIALNDGSTISSLQVVIDENTSVDDLSKINFGSSLDVEGILIESQGKGQAVEVLAKSIAILGECNPNDFPLQPKKQTVEFLRENAHLRMRTNTFGAVFKIRHGLTFAIHNFFNERGFYNVHTPIITGSDAEGAGEMFRVTTMDAKTPPLDDEGNIDYKQDFFGKETNLTVSGQLEAETAALALGKVYTFGPTFRAENSNTTRHAAEFWMIEPEVAFADIHDNMDLAEEFLQYCCKYALDNYAEELEFLNKRELDEEKNKKKEERNEFCLLDRLKFITENEFERVTYTRAIELLRNSKPFKKGRFNYEPVWGNDLQTEHERYLVEKAFKKPVIIVDYPESFKAFYMRRNEDEKTVAAMDVLFPNIGEIIGGSQREERLDVLKKKVKAFDIDEKEAWWYLQLRQFGSVPHSGFGLGFERLVMFVTGMTNIRDVIPFPRTPKNAQF